MSPLRALGVLCFVVACVACGKAAKDTHDAGAGAPVATGVSSSPSVSGEAGAESGAPTTDSGASAAVCPADMVHVDTTFCPSVERHCTDMEHEEKNHLEICHAFSHETRCKTPDEEKRIDFCIDRYEYPNVAGGHPVWMLDWYQAQATCESKSKRLCMASEWTAACEGPEHTPFPYGWERDHTKCNMDNFFIDPRKPGPRAQFFFYSKDPAVAFPELSRLDQSVPSGSLPDCTNGFGVHDQPGNMDEWTVNDGPPHEKSQFAALKGGAWGHVRSQCRPTTFSHEPDFTYYFVSFRCCKDADDGHPEARWVPSPQAVPAPSVEPHDFAPTPIVPIDAPGPSKTKFSRVIPGHVE